jgi:hypothetical protein
MPERSLESLLAGLSNDCLAVVLALREVVARIVPTAEERVQWGGLCYHRPWVGGPVKGAVCQIVAKHGKVRLDFIHGVRLSDPHHLLAGSALSKRYIPIETVADAQRPEIAELIRAAAEVEFA